MIKIEPRSKTLRAEGRVERGVEKEGEKEWGQGFLMVTLTVQIKCDTGRHGPLDMAWLVRLLSVLRGNG